MDEQYVYFDQPITDIKTVREIGRVVARGGGWQPDSVVVFDFRLLRSPSRIALEASR